MNEAPAEAGTLLRITYREACRQAIREALAEDPRTFVMGEDVGLHGGCYAVTKGLLDEFGPSRIRDTPLAESAFVGAGIGAAMAGLRLIVEIMTCNFSLLALDQILNNAPARGSRRTRPGERRSRDHGLREKYTAKYPKAVECLTKDRHALLAFFDFPAEHWDHLRTSNPIESVFATVRHRTVRTKGALSQKTARLMVFKLAMAASKTWRRLKGENCSPMVIAGVKFTDGIAHNATADERAA